MNKPAPKEPSMDEILSSIRQIIADDDAAITPKKPMAAMPPAQAATPAPRPFPTMAAAAPKPALSPLAESRPSAMPAPRPIMPQQRVPEPEAPEPLALSAEQILTEEDSEDENGDPVTALSFEDILAVNDSAENSPAAFAGEPELVDPEDIAFEADDQPEDYETEDDEPMGFSVAVEEPVYTPPPVAVQPTPAPRPMPTPPQPAPQQYVPRPAASVAQAAPMPDPSLSTEMAERLLEPTTQSAVKHAFARLSGLSMVGSGVTIEDMMREMLRPMLKEWLDENLPSIVESMVEKEIARISRGVE